MQDPATFNPMKPHFPELEQLQCPRCESTNTKFCYYNNYNLSQPRHFCKNCRRYWTRGGALRNIPVGGGTRKSNTKKRQKPDPDPSRSNPTRKSQETANTQSMLPAAATTSTSSQEPAVTLSSAVARDSGTEPDPRRFYGLPLDQDHKMLDITGSFSSLLASNGGLGSVLDGINPNGSGFKMVPMGGFGENFVSDQSLDLIPVRGPGSQNQGNNNGGESFMQSGNNDSSCWSGGSNGWPDLAIYTPSSNFQ